MKSRILKGFLKLIVSVLLLWVAMNIPSYFLSVDSSVLKSFKDSQDKEGLALLYLSTAKPKVANLLLGDNAEGATLRQGIDNMLEENPLWELSGSKNAFFDDNINLISPSDFKAQSIYEYLASASNRNAFLKVLSYSKLPLVKDILALRNLNTTLLPPAFSSAGAPYSASIIITAILVQDSALSPNMLNDLARKIPLISYDNAIKTEFEKYCLGLLFFAKNMSFAELSEITSKLNNLEEMSLLARDFAFEVGGLSFTQLSSAFLLYPNAKETIKYLDSAKPTTYEDYIQASDYSKDALGKILSEGLAIYKVPSYCDVLPLPLEDFFAKFSAYSTKIALGLKLLLIFFACYVLLSINIFRADTPNWYSPLSILRASLGAVVLASLICLAIEPAIFDLKIAEENPVEIKLAMQNLSNLIGENNIMKFNMDTATILTLSLFLLMQFVIFASCLIKIASIKRMGVSPSVKIELLSNEDNLFDLGLYVGLGGTVLSLIMLSLSMMNTALMAGYSSTLFGIMFTALLKIAFVRPYRHRLLLEIARNR